MSDKPRLFISYARADDEPFVERLYHDLKTAGFNVWWDRVSMPNRGVEFTREIEAAISTSQRVLLVVGPVALNASEYVAREWGYAIRAGKAISPLLRKGAFDDLPGELRFFDTRDFTQDDRYGVELERLLLQITEPPAPMGKFIGIPSLPRHMLMREGRLEALKDALRSAVLRPTGITSPATKAGLHGMGGIGKSVLAAALAHDVAVRRMFPDGIAWATIGQQPEVRSILESLLRDLGDATPIESIVQGSSRLRDALNDKAMLLILDDVWERAQAEPLDVLGPQCRMLITTRDASLVTSLEGEHYPLELLTDTEARALLAEWAGIPAAMLPPQHEAMIAECGRLPLAIALCGAMLRDGTPWRGTPTRSAA